MNQEPKTGNQKQGTVYIYRMKRPLPAFTTASIIAIGFLCRVMSPSAAYKPAYIPPDVVKAGIPDSMPVIIKHNFTNYSLNEGLGAKEVYAMFVDSRQLVWIGTYGGGAYCYDGISFTNYTVKDGLLCDIVWSFAEDSSGNILMATDKGVSRFDGITFTDIATHKDLGTHFTWDVMVDHNQNIWITTAGKGVFRYDGDTFKVFNKDNGLPALHVWDVMEDTDGNIWCAMNRGGVCKIKNDEITAVYDPDSLLKETTVRHVFQDSEGNIWASSTKGAARIKGDSCKLITASDGLAGSSITSVYEDIDGNLWFSCYENGISKLNRSTNQWTTYTTSDGLSGMQTWRITGDRNRNIWIGTNDNGISKLEESAFIHYQPLNDEHVTAAIRDKQGTFWVGTYNGLIHLTDRGFYVYGTKQGLPSPMIYSLYEDTSGNIWMGTRSGAVCYDQKSFAVYGKKQGMSGTNIYSITGDDNGSIWLGSNRSLYRISNHNLTSYLEPEGLGHYFIHQVRNDGRGRLWIGFFGGGAQGGVDCFDPNEVDGNPKAFHHFTNASGLANNNVVCTATDRDGNIWISTISDGLCVLSGKWYNEPDTAKWIIEKLTQQDGLSSNMITSLMVDNDGSIWAGSGNGLNRISGKQGHRVVTVYSSSNGFRGIECSDNVSFTGEDGRLYFGSGNYLSIYDKNLDHIDTVAPLLQVTGLKLFFENINWDSAAGIEKSGFNTWYRVPNNLSLPYNQNHVTISFRGITHRASQGVRYQWKMDGFDEQWNPVSDKREATYSNLPPGNYNFLVRSFNAQGKWNETPVSFAFEVRPPFWATWWFRIASAFVFIGSLYGGIKLRTRALLKKKRELELTVAERTAEVVQQKQEIVDSINYAKRLQEALLPPEKMIRELLPDSFVLYLPKDIVAGDFYWMERKDNLTFIAAGDCTGHGVPGAMVSVVCSNALNRAVKEFGLSDPGEILDKVRELVVETFEKSESEVKDGMDVSLCAIDSHAKEIVWAGANNPLWILRNNSSEMEIITADKQPVGKTDYAKPFTSHRVKINSGDVIYLFTDGYADQFGGPKGKKFKYKPLQELLVSLRSKSMEDQRSFLGNTIMEWRGNLEQVDDVLIIGIQLSFKDSRI